MQSIWWQVFDILGTSAFALSGALVAISRRMDLFGIFVAVYFVFLRCFAWHLYQLKKVDCTGLKKQTVVSLWQLNTAATFLVFAQGQPFFHSVCSAQTKKDFLYNMFIYK